MKFYLCAVVLFFSQSLWAQSVEIEVSLSPAGSFRAQTSQVKGFASKKGDAVTAEGVLVDLRSISTGIGLRDKHLQQRLMVEKYPVAKLVMAKGVGGRGKAVLEIKGQKVNVSGDYTVSGNVLKANFKMTMSSLDIKDVKYMGVGARDEVTVHITLPVKGSL